MHHRLVKQIVQNLSFDDSLGQMLCIGLKILWAKIIRLVPYTGAGPSFQEITP